jgi:hypothetical protein
VGDFLLVLLWFVLGVATACLCYRLAIAKGRDPKGWVVFGFLVPVVGLIALALVPRSSGGARA